MKPPKQIKGLQSENVKLLDYHLEEFIASFAKAKDLPMFSWMTKIINGYKREFLNIDEQKASDITRRLTSISNERFKVET